MKARILTVFSLFIIASALGQEPAPVSVEKKHNRIYFNMPELFFNTFAVTYERDIKRNALQLSAGGILIENENKSRNGAAGELQFRFNLVDEKPGYDRTALFYLAPYAQYKYIDAEETVTGTNNNYPINTTYTYTSTANLQSYHVGAVLGLSLYAFKGRFCTSFFGGGGLRKVIVTGDKNLFENNVFQVAYSGVMPRFGFQLGLGF